MFAPFLEVRMLEKGMPLWREVHFQVKLYKTLGVHATYGGSDVEKCMQLWREAGFEIKIYKTLGVRTTFSGSDIYITQQDITLYYTPPVHYITLHDTPGHSTALNYTTPHYITLNY